MKVTPTTAPDVPIIEPLVFGSARGFFCESLNQEVFNDAIGLSLICSARGVLCALHYQEQQLQGALVRVACGSVFDVVVDIRKFSPTFGKWIGLELNVDNYRQSWVPPEVAHSFFVLTDAADFLHKTADYHAPEHECSIGWNDPDIRIEWLTLSVTPSLSAKNQVDKLLANAEAFA